MCVTCTTHTYISNSILEPKATEAKAKTLFRKGKFCKEKPKKFVEKENNQRIQKKTVGTIFECYFDHHQKNQKQTFRNSISTSYDQKKLSTVLKYPPKFDFLHLRSTLEN